MPIIKQKNNKNLKNIIKRRFFKDNQYFLNNLLRYKSLKLRYFSNYN